MAYRKSANGRGAKRSFTRNAMRVHKKNIVTKPSRGGIRL